MSALERLKAETEHALKWPDGDRRATVYRDDLAKALTVVAAAQNVHGARMHGQLYDNCVEWVAFQQALSALSRATP